MRSKPIYTSLQLTIRNKHFDLLEQLISLKIDFNETNQIGNTALYDAIENQIDLKYIKLLLNAGIDVNHQNNNGSTPLHYASIMGNIEIAEVLLDYGADVNIKDNFDQLPIDMANESEMVVFIENYPLDIKEPVIEE